MTDFSFFRSCGFLVCFPGGTEFRLRDVSQSSCISEYPSANHLSISKIYYRTSAECADTKFWGQRSPKRNKNCV